MRRRGFTLAEVAVVVAIVGILAGLAVPHLAGMVAVVRTRAAANRVAADLAYTRQLAARTGWAARLVIVPAADCPPPPTGVAGHRYRIVRGDGSADSVVARVDLRASGGRVCLSSNRSAQVPFNARGLPAGAQNRTLVVREGRYPADTLTLSQVGRVRRRY